MTNRSPKRIARLKHAVWHLQNPKHQTRNFDWNRKVGIHAIRELRKVGL